jgi:hypothetical protein
VIDLDCNCGRCKPYHSFRCDLCGRDAPWCCGADDAVERYLGSSDGGVCDECWSKLPKRVHRAAERRDRMPRSC